MKNVFHKLVQTTLLCMALVFTACQEEFEEVGGNQQETIRANSNTAFLIENTASNDGSFDNIVDSASCFAINFPYTVEVNDIQITIDSREDLQVIEEIFDEFDTDVDILDIIFPITITFGDFSELTIESFEQLRELAAQCTEGGDDDDIECIDFVYPITLFTFDINEQRTGEVTVDSDEELRRFFDGLEDDELVSIQFPLTLIKFDGTEMVVNSNSELAFALEQARDVCDEDDDDDFNDDDFTKERLDAFLVECPWEIREVRRSNVDRTEVYLENLLTFSEDGSVVYQDPTGNMLTGEWDTRVTDDGAVLNLVFEQLVDFTLQWFVYEIDGNRIKLFSGDDNRIILRQNCDDNGDVSDISVFREILKECEWIIRRVENQGEEINRLLGFKFQFLGEGVLTLSDGITTSEGTWEVGLNDDEVPSLLISLGDEGSINFDWPLRELLNERLRFEVEEIGYELVLQRTCDDDVDDVDVREIRNILLGGQWNVALYENEGVDATDDYADLDFNFSMFNQVEVSVNDDPQIAGLWRISRNSLSGLQFFLNFQDDGIFGELTEAWYIIEVDPNRIELVFEDETVNSKRLVFEKL